MGIKIPKVLLKETSEYITPKEYEERLEKKGSREVLSCSCGAKIDFVKGYSRKGDWINPFFRTNRLSSHLEDCEYRLSNQVKKIAKEASECLPFINGKYQFSLKIIYFSEGKTTTEEEENQDFQRSTIISYNNKKFQNYIKTLREILQLRERLEEEKELSEELSLSYFGKVIKWDSFYFVYKNYNKAFEIIRKWRENEGYPLCFEGYPKWVEKVSKMYLYGEEKGGKKPALELYFPNKDMTSLLSEYPRGTKILVYGKVELVENQNSIFNNMKMTIYNDKQIIKIEN